MSYRDMNEDWPMFNCPYMYGMNPEAPFQRSYPMENTSPWVMPNYRPIDLDDLNKDEEDDEENYYEDENEFKEQQRCSSCENREDDDDEQDAEKQYENIEEEDARVYCDVEGILRRIEKNNPNVIRRLTRYGISYPMARNMVSRCINLTLMYSGCCKK